MTHDLFWEFHRNNLKRLPPPEPPISNYIKIRTWWHHYPKSKSNQVIATVPRWSCIMSTPTQKYRLSTTVSFSLYLYHLNHIVSSVLCTSLLQKYRLCTSVICKHCISYKKVKQLCDDHPLDYWNKWDTHKGQSSSCINITRYIGEF